MSMKQAYQEKLQARLDEWSAEIEKLEAKVSEAQADSKIEYEKQLRELREHRDAAETKLKELRDAGDDAWQDMKAGLDNAWDSLSGAFSKAAERFK